MNLRSLILLPGMVSLLSATEWDIKGQLSFAGASWESAGIWYGSAGLQYIPNLQISRPFSRAHFMDFELAFYGFLNQEAGRYRDDIRPYRLNLRYATPQSEIQLGLQKINFGPAQLLRALMWFERQNPTDPLNIAEGIWGLRYRHIFLSNTNIWLWGLYGNGDAKGLETYGSVKDMPEFGGRVQTPVPMGEMAVTFHTRSINYLPDNVRENRIALDGRWDILVGVWFEALVQHQKIAAPYHYTKMLTLGLDYTFGIGNGLYVVGEHMINQLANEFHESDQDAQLTAFMLNYPLGLFDNLVLMTFYSWKTDDVIQYISWQRSYDKIMLNLALFHFPDIQLSTINTFGSDVGIRLMLIYNH